MIRLNPTSIRLRPADVKALQDELERRREAAASAANTSAAAATENQSKAKTKPANGHGRRDTRDATSSSRTRSHNNQNAPDQAAHAEERRLRRAGMSAQERIGYISRLVLMQNPLIQLA